METKIFGGKKIKIRKLSRNDLRNVKKFRDYINALVEENVQVIMNRRVSLKEEKKWLKEELKKIKNRKKIKLIAEKDNLIVGIVDIPVGSGRQSHVGDFGISIRNGYRGIGLGTYLMQKIIKLAKKELKPKPKIIRLSVFPTNKLAIGLYKKFGFKKVAKIPKQFKYKGKLIDEIIMIKEI